MTGVFGFVTPESGYPTAFSTLTFDVRSYAWSNLAGDGSEKFAEVYGEAVDLTVNFDTNAVTATLTGTASSDIDDDGVDVEALIFTATNTSVNADLFGNTPERISGVFSGDFTLSDGAGLSASGEGAGFLDAQVD